MKLRIVFLLIVICNLQVRVYSQTLNLDISQNDVLVENILKEIREKSDYEFVYSNDDLKKLPPVSIDLKNATIEQILDACLGNTQMTYKINKKVIIISPRIQTPKPVDKKQENKTKSIKGKVTDKKTGEPLSQVNIIIPGTSLGTISDANGDYVLGGIPSEKNKLKFHYIGYETKEVNLSFLREQFVNVELTEQVVKLNDVVVTPGRFTISEIDRLKKQLLTKQDLQNIAFGEDVYRAVSRLPGISSSDYSAKFNVRGGEANEILVMIDGMQLYEPFHLKDILGGIFSIIDVYAIEKIDIMTSGFPAGYGDRMSAVFEMTSVKPEAGKKKLSAGVSLMNTRIFSAGTFANDNGSWLISARRGYLDLVMGLLNEKNDITPKYYDLYGKTEYKLNNKHTISANILYSSDKLSLTEDDADFSETGYGSKYFWIGLNSRYNDKISSRTIASIGNINNRKEGTAFMGEEKLPDFNVEDKRNFTVGSIKQDWICSVADFYNLSWGFDLKISTSDYDFESIKKYYFLDSLMQINSFEDKIDINGKNNNNQVSLYLSNRLKVFPSLIFEAGMRYDFISITDEHLFSPRINLAFQVSKKTSVLAGWGNFYQSQNLNELNIQDDDIRFFTSEKAENYGIGIEHRFSNGIDLRVEGYHKKQTNLRPIFRNLENNIEIFPELQDDRRIVNLNWAKSKGIELFLKYDEGGKISWWTTYVFAFADEKIKHFEEPTPRPVDQRHTFCFDMNYRPTNKWQFGLAFQYRSGWPYTIRTLESDPVSGGGYVFYDKYGKYNGNRYPDYTRLDIRANRNFKTSFGDISIYTEIVNCLDHKNIRGIDYQDAVTNPDGTGYFNTKEYYWFPILPVIGITWSLEYN